MLLMRTGFLTMFYLVPLGYAVLSCGSFMFTFFTAVLTNLVIFLFSNMSSSGSPTDALIEIIYLSVLIFLFTWVVGGKKVRTAYRIILAASLCALIFIFVLSRIGTQLYAVFMETAEEIMPGLVTREMFDIIKNILLRGGALASIVIMLYASRQIAVGLLWLIKKQRKGKGLAAFYAPLNTIWVFSGSLATVITASVFGIEILSIIAWNVFIICVIIFLAQGAGVLTHFLAGKSLVFRLCSAVFFIFMLFSPLTVIIMAAVLVLGIVEIWRPFRRA